jgi:hypothetical protein
MFHFYLRVNHTYKNELNQISKTFKKYLMIDLKLGYLKFTFLKTDFRIVYDNQNDFN